jgi:hypothetical protein
MFTPAFAWPVLPRLPGRGCWWLFLRLRFKHSMPLLMVIFEPSVNPNLETVCTTHRDCHLPSTKYIYWMVRQCSCTHTQASSPTECTHAECKKLNLNRKRRRRSIERDCRGRKEGRNIFALRLKLWATASHPNRKQMMNSNSIAQLLPTYFVKTALTADVLLNRYSYSRGCVSGRQSAVLVHLPRIACRLFWAPFLFRNSSGSLFAT